MSPQDQAHPYAAGAARETEIEWDQASAFMRRRLGHELPSSCHGLIDDLTQETLVRLLRAVRREPVQNIEALMTEIARRTAIDGLRRRTRWSAIVGSDDAGSREVADPGARADQVGDPLERLHFVVLEFFTAREARCLELAEAYFAERDWKVVATARGRSHDAVRKQWSRCLEVLREAARDEAGPLADWARPQ